MHDPAFLIQGDWEPGVPAAPADGGVHVWRAEIDVDLGRQEDLERELSPGERDRAHRYRHEIHRRRFTHRRFVLRRILAGVLGTPAAEVELVEEANKKPRLSDRHGRTFAFSLSHSSGAVLVAVGGEGALGVDIEAVDPAADVDRLVRRVGSAADASCFAVGDRANRVRRFFHLWAVKEAYVKAEGLGLARDLRSLSIEPPWWEAGRSVRVQDERHPARRWPVVVLPGTPEFASALAGSVPWTFIHCRTFLPTTADAYPR